jgi:hypothetical protein
MPSHHDLANLIWQMADLLRGPYRSPRYERVMQPIGAMGVAPQDGIVSPAYNVDTPGPALAPAYIDALARMPIFAREVARYSKGVWSSRLRLYPEGFFAVWLPVPPLDEQLAVVAHISAETAKLDALRASTEGMIALLKERRAALIAAAVTGKIDPRGTGVSCLESNDNGELHETA